jgi:hydrogenase maturation protease
MRGDWAALEQPAPDAVTVAGVEVRRGTRVRLHPTGGGDIWSRALDGRRAVVDALVCDVAGEVQLAVVVEDDPGRDLGADRGQPGHRFFFGPEEVEPLAPARDAAASRILLAGIGNVFLGDDGFGVALASRLARRELPPGVDVVDYGIRGMDLAYAMSGYEVVVLLDATPRGDAPGTLYVIEPEIADDVTEFEAHGMDPVTVLALARTLGGALPRTLVVGCEPRTRMSLDDEELLAELSAPVQAALDGAERLVRSLVDDLIAEAHIPGRTA